MEAAARGECPLGTELRLCVGRVVWRQMAPFIPLNWVLKNGDGGAFYVGVFYHRKLFVGNREALV